MNNTPEDLGIARDRSRNRQFPWIVLDNIAREYHCERCGQHMQSRAVSDTRKATELAKFVKRHRGCHARVS